jgi:hypothetical protein
VVSAEFCTRYDKIIRVYLSGPCTLDSLKLKSHDDGMTYLLKVSFCTLHIVTIYILISVLRHICTLILLVTNWEYLALAAVFSVAVGNWKELVRFV